MGEIFAKAGAALAQVLLVGIVLGAGLPAIYAAGMKALTLGRETTPDGHMLAGKVTPAGMVLAALCFGIVVAAVLFGIVVIVFGKQIFGGGH